jgi:hypothetical protein
LGYGRVSISDQNLDVQRLSEEAGAIRVLDDVLSSKNFDRPG